MKVSYKWLQTYFKDPLPPAEKIAELITFHVFEVESTERIGEEIIFDIKVLPDRAPYCLSHQGIAAELSALIKNTFIPRDVSASVSAENTGGPEVVVADANFCDRYAAVGVMNISGTESPAWLKERLHSVGQRSINLVVDLLNFVMLDIGQPMHAFDAENIVGKISVRAAKKDEKITTLDNKEITLTPEDFVVADDVSPLAIAGVKGGKKAEVSLHTERIVVEAAHFNATSVRKTSTRTGIHNDSSKRFENNVSATKPVEALNYFLSLLVKENPGVSIGEIVDINYFDEKQKIVSVPIDFIPQYLGTEISGQDIVEILKSSLLPCEREGENILIRVPSERLDINIKEDVADEVGRIIGYEKIAGIVPELYVKREANKEISWKNTIRNFFVERGYSEIYTYALASSGEVEIENPLASDKAFMRKNLTDEMEKKIVSNLYNADLLGLSKIKLFEIGKVFSKNSENTSLAVGIGYKKVTADLRPNDEVKEIRDELLKYIGVVVQILCTIDDSGGIISHNGKQIGLTNNKDGIMEIDLDYLISLLPEVTEEVSLVEKTFDTKYKPVSIYPFVSRDIAVFVPGEAGKEDEVLEVIKKFAVDLLVRADLFDTFTKMDKESGERKTSYAYRIILQSYDKTLSEEEINKIMKDITDYLNAKQGWQVR